MRTTPVLAVTVPSTEAQQEIWSAAQMGAGASCAFNQALYLSLRGALDVAALQAAVQDLLERHEALRSTFSADGSRCRVGAAWLVEMPVLDLSAADEHQRELQLADAVNREVTEPFDLERGPLFRVRLLRLREQEHVVLLTAHHIVCDGWSVGVLLRDLGALYSARRQGTTAFLADAPRFSEYALAKEGELGDGVHAAAERYWRSRFEDGIPTLELPTRGPRPAVRSFQAAREDWVLTPALAAGLRRLCAGAGCTQFAALLAALQVFLFRLSGQEDVVVGIPAADQPVLGSEGLVGHCLSLLPLRTRLSGEQRFRDCLKAAQIAVADAFDHRSCTFGTLIRKLQLPRDPRRIPLVSVVLNADRAAEGLGFDGLEAECRWTPRRFESFELHLNALETSAGLVLECTYNTDLFDAAAMRQRLEEFATLLAGLVADPDRMISRVPLIPEAERRRRLVEWNDTRTDYPRDATIVELFEAQVARAPDALAVTYEGEALTYGQLNARANQLAHYLRRRGVGPDVLVGLCIERSLEMVVGVLGIVKAGGAYVALDPEYPAERLAFMLADTQAAVVLTQRRCAARAAVGGTAVVVLDADGSDVARESVENPGRASRAQHLAYVVYTSGSTGRPKGVCIEQRSVVRLVMNTNYVDLGPGEVFLQYAPMAFDAATFELWGSLLHGAKLVVAPAGTLSLAELTKLIERERVSVLWLTAAVFHQVVEQHWERLRHVRQVLAGGETLSVAHVQRALGGLREGQRLINGYGPTENTTFTCCHVMTRTSRVGATVPIGRPIANTRVYVLDAQGQELPVGVAGELYIGGDGLAREYLRKPVLTAERFVTDPVRGRLYRSGDLVRYLPDGTLDFLGRLDRQVKMRGFRIEPGEIESVLTEHECVTQASVSVREGSQGAPRLVAYVVGRAGQVPSVADLRDHLRATLPGYMVPQHIIPLDALPLTPNGKVDSNALPAPGDMARALEEDFVPPRTALEKLIAGMWQEMLATQRIGVYDNFFDLGGHSLLAMKVIDRVQQRTGHRFALVDLARETLGQLATACERTTGAAARRAPRHLLHRAARAIQAGLRWTRPTE